MSTSTIRLSTPLLLPHVEQLDVKYERGVWRNDAAGPLRAIAEGAKVTWFLAKSDPVTAKKRWIAGHLEPAGHIVVDAGAEKALLSGKSLLPAGVASVFGDFDRGDADIIRALDGRELGRGLIAYSINDARLIIGKRSSEIAKILGYDGRDTLVHRDDMALSRK